jgi:hypothetical protein
VHALIALIAVGASPVIGLHLEHAVSLPLESAVALTNALGRAIEARTNRKVVLDDPIWSSCDKEDRCLPEIAARVGTAEVVFVSVFASVTQLKLVAQLGVWSDRIERTLPKDAAAWPEPLDEIAARLFSPGAPVTTASTAPSRPVEKVRAFPIAPIIAGGGAIVAGAVAFGFSKSAASARDTINTSILVESDYQRLEDRIGRDGTLAWIFLATALAATAATALFTFLSLD